MSDLVLMHSDCHTIMVGLRCPKCGLYPDMQSTEFTEEKEENVPIVRKMVTESLGSSASPESRPGYVEPKPSVEELALTACHEAAEVLYGLYLEATGFPQDADVLATKLDNLYDRWRDLDVWKPGEPRVPVAGAPGRSFIDWPEDRPVRSEA